jgi:hypothetical protein
MTLPRALRVAVASGLAAVALCALPDAGTAQRPGRDCDRNPNDSLCQQIKKRQEINDRQKGITPACRAAADRYGIARRKADGYKRTVGQWKSALKKAKSDKARKKAKKALKKAKKSYAKARKPVPGLRNAAVTACVAAKVKPY